MGSTGLTQGGTVRSGWFSCSFLTVTTRPKLLFRRRRSGHQATLPLALVGLARRACFRGARAPSDPDSLTLGELPATPVLLLVSMQCPEYVQVLCTPSFGISVIRKKLVAYLTPHSGKQFQAPRCSLVSLFAPLAHAAAGLRIPDNCR
jgi:hypothetical protein